MSTGTLTANYEKSARASVGQAFVAAFVVCLVLLSVPIKNAGYLAPPLFIGLMFLTGNTAFVRRALLWICFAVCLSTLSIMADSLYGQDVNMPGLFLGVMTYSSLVVMLSLRSDFTIDSQSWDRLNTVVAWWAIAQSIVGFGQFALSRNADAVCGTMGLLEGLTGYITITQVYFTFNLFSMVLFMLLDMRRTLTKVAVVLSLLACMLAHSGHQTLFLMAAVVVVGMLQLRVKDVVKLAAFLAVLLSMMLTVSTIYWENIEGWYRKSLVDEDSPKRMVTVAAGEILSSPKNMLLGAGIGQYGSRAALITSGEYLSIPLPKMLIGESEYYREFVLPAHEEYELYGEHSAITKPYYSALSMIVEFGLPLSMLLLLALGAQFASNWRLARSTTSRARAVGVLANVGLVFLLLCCLIENYLEFPQAIFLPTLLYVAARTLKGEAE